jgi:DNA-3-methyladenine glycosylase II
MKSNAYKSEIAVLLKQDPTLKSLFGAVELQEEKPRNAEPYTALVRAIAHQMVHGNAAKACLARLAIKAGGVLKKGELVADAAFVGKLTQMQIKECGFTTNKSRAIYEIAQKTISGELPTKKQLQKMSDEEIIKTLVPLRGVGKWTVEMYLMFSLGRMDIFPVDDFGVREGYRIWKKEKTQRDPNYLRKRAERWAPYRTIVAFACWRMADAYKKIKT